MNSKLPAGLIDGNIEFFAKKDSECFVLYNGKVEAYEKSIEGRLAIISDMESNISEVSKLRKLGFSGLELEKKWIFCRFGGFDNIPDVDLENGNINPEYHECIDRATCPYSGVVCKLPASLSHKEVETVKAVATGEPAKLAADRINVSFNTFRSYLKSVHKKTGAHSRADLMNFAYKNNLI